MSTVSLHLLVLREVVEVSSWHLEFEVCSYPERVSLKALSGHLEVDVANGSVWAKRREQLFPCGEAGTEALLCRRGLLPP